MNDIKAIRNEKGLSVAELSDLTDVPAEVIVSLEENKLVEVKIGFLLSIADALGKKVDELFLSTKKSLQ